MSSISSSRKRIHSDTGLPPQKKARPVIKLPPLGYSVQTNYVPGSIKVPKSGYTAGTKLSNSKRPSKVVQQENLEKLSDGTWNFATWNGDVARPILDANKRMIGILAGIPEGPEYQEHCQNARRLMIRLGDEGNFSDKQREHARGSFPTVDTGVAFGPGSPESHNLSTSPHDQDILQQLLSNESMQYLAKMQNAAFKRWIPKLHSYYETQLNKLWTHNPKLKKPFSGSVWPKVAFNLSRNVTCLRHRDSQNLVYGVCAITSLGDFDHRYGGHLVLPDLRWVVEFPPGAIILIPSALFEHANTPVQEGEERLSFTQYCPGAHFRYVDFGFRTCKEVEANDKEEYKRLVKKCEKNEENGRNMYPTFEQLHNM